MNDSITTARKTICRASCPDGVAFSQRGKTQAGPGNPEHTDLVVSPGADQGQYNLFF